MLKDLSVRSGLFPFRLWILAPEVCLYKPMARIRSFLGVGQALGYPSPLSALPQAMNVIRSTSIDFAENQLYPILVIRIGKPGRAFPPMDPHVQVSSHPAQMTNGKSRPLAGPKRFLRCGLNEISALGLGVRRNSVSAVSGTRRNGLTAGPFPVPSGPGFRPSHNLRGVTARSYSSEARTKA